MSIPTVICRNTQLSQREACAGNEQLVGTGYSVGGSRGSPGARRCKISRLRSVQLVWQQVWPVKSGCRAGL